MKSLEKKILIFTYVSELKKEYDFELLCKKQNISPQDAEEKIDWLIKEGMINEDRKTLTEFGRGSLRVVLAGGVFDIIHPGHIHTLKAAKELGDVLVIVIATDKTTEKMKKRKPLHNQKLRRELVDSLSMVNICLIGDDQDMFNTVNKVKPEIIALGYDQVHQEKFIMDGCRRIKLDVKVARLQSPIPELSSSEIQKQYGDEIHGL